MIDVAGRAEVRGVYTREKPRSQETIRDALPPSAVQGGCGLSSLCIGQTESRPRCALRTPDGALHGAVLSGNVGSVRTIPENSALTASDLWPRSSLSRWTRVRTQALVSGRSPPSEGGGMQRAASVLIPEKQTYCRAQVCLLTGAGRTGTGWRREVGEEDGDGVFDHGWGVSGVFC